MAQQQVNAPAAVIEAIKRAEEAGRDMTDTEVAALAAGVLDVADVEGTAVPMAQSDEEKGKEGDENHSESDEESSSDEDEEERDEKETAKISTADQSASAMEVEDEVGGADWRSGKGKEKEKIETNGRVSNGTGVSNGDGIGASNGHGTEEGVKDTEVAADGQTFVTGITGSQPVEESSDEGSSSDSSDGDIISGRALRRGKPPMLPTSGPKAYPPAGDISDGDDEDGFGTGVPMTKNEAEEAILPLGEVTMDGAEVMEVGTILSLVETDGTIVVQGTQGRPPLDEGSVLSSHVKGCEASGATEPLGRVHEIFGPCHTPHYTVKVEGAANKHILLARHQTIEKKLVKMEKERAREVKTKVGSTLPKPPPSTDDNATGSLAQAAVSEIAPMSTVPDEKRKEAKLDQKDNPDIKPRKSEVLAALVKGPPILAELETAVTEAEAVLSELKEHPFQRWQVGAKVYAVKDHAKFLSKELLVPSGKGTDASNCHDEEAEEEEFSDDEQERLAKLRGRADKKRNKMVLQGVAPEEIAKMEREEAEQRRVLHERRQAERAARGDGGGRRGRGGRGRGGRGGRGNANGASNGHSNGSSYYGNGGNGRGDGARRGSNGGRNQDGSPTGWNGVGAAQGRNNQAPHGNGAVTPISVDVNGVMTAPVHTLQQPPPTGYAGHPLASVGSPHTGSGGATFQSPPGGGYPPVGYGGGGGMGGGVPPPQHQRQPPYFVPPPPQGMMPNPSQFVQQQHQQHFQYQQQMMQPPPSPSQHQQQYSNGGYPAPPMSPGGRGGYPPHGPNGGYYPHRR